MNLTELKEIKKKEKRKRINSLEIELSSVYKELNDVNKANSYLVLKVKEKEKEIERLRNKVKELKRKE